ncbi:murein biosynthesis integral membrane protein MurJ [Prochlorococcus marinus]|uniref:Probable lipid II flippase MurJ n=1 Tax=Prochlorococcus marinus XMU1408 TaxID=2213228 RepID=A0A318R2H1_PROMR|nr:murein biosynthesis integral membrane protein MurJ [Prochlorococcus marinus]MBW3041319.1 murein biosynthesis integral membrane protein MurJ [Prochlorococcus marinus str. XMU1408]PYE02494.1 murein biosynthesis integral membrane protein MurJ [Prochlorococcus marinus XMU1408]
MTKTIKEIAFIVTLGTLFSKFGGMARQLVIAGAFGISASYDAYNYAYIIPGFFLVLLGGVNGPFHNSMVTLLADKNKVESKLFITSINTILTLLLLLVSVFIFFSSDFFINLVGPSLTAEVKEMASSQLKIMSPIVFISGLIGLGFGSLNAKKEFFIPSISPLISSLIIIIAIADFWLNKGNTTDLSELDIKGGVILAKATFIGALSQYLIQIPFLINKGIFSIRFSIQTKYSELKRAWKMIAPASLSSGMMQINVFTDLFFASKIIGAAAALSYANFLIQAPLGIISNTILIPLLPVFVSLRSRENHPKLIKKIHQGFFLSSTSMVFLGSIFVSLSTPIVILIYGRGSFNQNAIDVVSQLLIAYGIGMPFYLIRDLLVRIFYGIEDAKTPFRISIIAIVLNFFFDWFLIGGPSPWGDLSPLNLGVNGLVFSTTFVNFFACILLLLKLNKILNNLNLVKILYQNLRIIFIGFICGTNSFFIFNIINLPYGFIFLFFKILISSGMSLLIFNYLAIILKIDGIFEINKSLKKRFISL